MGQLRLQVIVPIFCVKALLSILNKKSEQGCRIEVFQRRVRFSAGDWSITSRAVDGSFPDYNRVPPRNDGPIVYLDATKFATAIGKLWPQPTTQSRGCRIDIADRTLQVNDGEYEVALPALARQGEHVCGVTIAYLRDMLSEFTRRNAKVLYVGCGQPGTPIMFRDMERSAALHIIMPMTVW